MFMSKEDFIRTGLAKSAFRESIYESLPVDFYVPYISSIQKYLVEMSRIRSKFYQSHDAFLMFYKPYHLVFQSLKKQNKASPVWLDVVKRIVTDNRFYDLNVITSNSVDLAIVAAMQLLQKLLKNVDVDQLQKLQDQPPQSPEVQKVLKEVMDKLAPAIDSAITTTLDAVKEFKELQESAGEAIRMLSGGHGYTKETLSVLPYLKDPDEFRRRVRILSEATRWLRTFMALIPTSLQHQQIASMFGGVNGVARMQSDQQIQDILSSELALTQLGDIGQILFAAKLALKQLNVYQRAATVKPVIFIDKSGSMAEAFEEETGVPKISVATGLALALYKKLNADIYLFDTELEKVNPSKIVETLLTIKADGGTNVDPVLSEIMNIGKKDYTYIIISDGITEASDDVLTNFIKSGLVPRTKLILVPPAYGSSSYKWVQVLKEAGNTRRVWRIDEFTNAITLILKSF